MNLDNIVINYRINTENKNDGVRQNMMDFIAEFHSYLSLDQINILKLLTYNESFNFNLNNKQNITVTRIDKE